MISLNLNRRHKAGLFLVLVATGLSLFFEASAKQTAGIVVLGVAATWLVGIASLRLLGFMSCSVVCVTGLCVAALPLLKEWNSYLAEAADYDRALVEIGAAVAEATAPPPPHPPGFTNIRVIVRIPVGAQKWTLPTTSTVFDGGLVIETFPIMASEAEILSEFKTKILLPRPTYSIAAVIRSNRVAFFGGVALFALGLAGFSGMVWWKRGADPAAIA